MRHLKFHLTASLHTWPSGKNGEGLGRHSIVIYDFW
jgi:hypothetical protein